MSDALATLAQSGVAALHRGDARTARSAFEQIDAAGRATPHLHLLLARACALQDDRTAAHRALDAVLGAEPSNLQALILRADLHAAANDNRAAVSWYQAALAQAPRAGQLPPDLLASLRRAEAAVGAAGAAFENHLKAHFADAGMTPENGGARFIEALDILTGAAAPHLQQPTSFFYPGLAPRPFFDPADFAWVPELEAAAPAIREELRTVLADEAAFAPYVVAEAGRPTKRHALLDDPAWSALHLWRGGAPVVENAVRCPVTMAALERVPLPRIDGRSPMALFSVLRAGTHIPPHWGMLNTRLICHLPLIVPAGCRLRVGNETRGVEQDHVMIFDDSIEHEAWNDGDATRVVLLFEIWRPDLDAEERIALTTLFEAITAYGGAAEDQGGA